ncbi:DegT/DnrJ/EryC1/StrS family aminotransferase [Campylobacter lanienae]|nr:DegT/DnrJ/EryC1/StrS family aminotransferase [Campylobacter lanienae]MDY6134471.1 DegT/DnrJ/EryC1/StrS family aminotransferase [Campylobacter lanienae]
MLISDDENVAKLARHLSTTAKIPHPYEYNHDYIAYNYRMPNLNAALLKAQLENLNLFLSKKRDLAKRYAKFFDSIGVKFISEPVDCLSNYWLMGVIMDDRKSRDELLKYANERSVMMRPAWRLLSELEIYKESIKDENKNAKYLADRIVNIPSSVVI